MALTKITSTLITDDAVTTAKINADAVDETKIADDAVNSEHLVDGGVDDAHLATDIDAGKLINALPALDGSNLTGVAPTKTTVEALGIELPAANLTGSIANARIPAGAVTQHVDTSTIENNIAMLAFKVATVGSLAKYDLVDQNINEFESSSGIDANASTNESLISGYYTGAYEILNSSMLDVTAVNGHGGSNEFYYGGGNPAVALLDGGTAGGGLSPYGGADAGSYVKVDLGSGNEQAFTQAKFYHSAGTPTNSWNVEWSTNNSSWTQAAGAQTSATTAGHLNWTWSSPGAKRYWRVKLTANVSNGPWWTELQFGFNGGTIPGLITQDLTLQSTHTTAQAVPTTGDIVMLMEDGVGTATLNTDIKAYVSRDNGSNWTQGTLASEGGWGTNKKILTFHNLDISGQPSGTGMRYKITTHNQSATKMTRIHAVSLAWA